MDAVAKSQRIYGLDCLRGVAILAVLIYHCCPTSQETNWEQVITWLRSFLWTGVDLFFVLSGFLITRILLRTRNDPHYFSTFYARRSLRVFPLYYLYVGVMILLPQLLTWIPQVQDYVAAESYQRLWDGQWWLWAYLHNFPQASGPSRFPGMGHMWSLAVEEQFYLVWPWLVWFMPERKLIRLLIALLIVTSLARWGASLAGMAPWSIMYLTYFRLDGLIIGSCVALVEQNATWNQDFQAKRTPILIASTTAVLGIGLFRKTFEWIDPGVQQFGYLAISILAGCVVHVIVNHPKADNQSSQSFGIRQIGLKLLASWGKYSYAIYILHMPIHHVVKHFASSMPYLVVFATATLSYAAAVVSWYAYELHWLKWKPEYSQKSDHASP